jgi:hypothetical protein
MDFIKGKLGWLSMMLLSAGYVAAPQIILAQQGEHESRAVQAAPNQAQPNYNGRTEWSQFREDNRSNAGRWNNGGRWSNSFGSFPSRDRDRDRDRGRRDRDRGHFGFYWGAPYYPYSYYPGFYYGFPYGYYSGSVYDMGYSDGFNAGRFDRIQGNMYNPWQYERSGDLDYLQGFVAGYENGYRS